MWYKHLTSPKNSSTFHVLSLIGVYILYIVQLVSSYFFYFIVSQFKIKGSLISGSFKDMYTGPNRYQQGLDLYKVNVRLAEIWYDLVILLMFSAV